MATAKKTDSASFPWAGVAVGLAVAGIGYALYRSQRRAPAAATSDKALAPVPDRQPTVFAVPFAFSLDAVTEVNQLFDPRTGEWQMTPNSEFMDDSQDVLRALFDKLEGSSLAEASKTPLLSLAPVSEASKAASALAACEAHEPPSPLVIYKWLTKGTKTSRYALLVRSCSAPAELVDISAVPTKQMPDPFLVANV